MAKPIGKVIQIEKDERGDFIFTVKFDGEAIRSYGAPDKITADDLMSAQDLGEEIHKKITSVIRDRVQKLLEDIDKENTQ